MDDKRFRYHTRPKANVKNIVSGDKYRFSILTPSLIRLEYDNDGVFEDRASQSVFYRDFDATKFDVFHENDRLIIKTDNLILSYIENLPFSEDSLQIKLLEEPASVWHYGDDAENLGGTSKTLDTVNGGMPLESGVCSRNGFSVLDDSDRMLLNSEDGWVEVRRKNTIDIYFFGYGFRYLDAVADYYRLTGIPPLLPAYALGNWWSRYYKYTQEEYLALMDKFKEENVPFSVGVIDMDWHTVDVPKELQEALDREYNNLSSGWTGYTWNKKLFPDYKKMLSLLKEKNLKVALNLHPAQGVRRHEEQFEEMAKALGVDVEKENVVPFDILSKEYMENYFDILHHPYERDGVDFWWMDFQQGTTYYWKHKIGDNAPRDEREILDPLWMLNHLHILDISRDGKRPMFFSRYCGPGSQRYPVGFSGDTIISWDSLNFQPYFTLTASNIGYGWWSHDIGGHMCGYRDDDLTLRWVELGVFSPINRLHSSNNDFICKEPWCFEEKYEKSIKKWLNLRHNLFPYLYTMNYRNHNDLIPLVCPMYYSHPKCDGAYKVDNQFWFGSELMVAPITTPCASVDHLGSVNVWMPKGDWFDFFNGTHYYSNKNRFIEVYRRVEDYPVFARAGAIIPTAIRENGDNRLRNFENMKISIFPGESNEFSLYEDSGDNFDYKNGEMVKTKLQLSWGEEKLFSINPAKGDLKLIPQKRNWTLEFKGFAKNVKLNAFIDGNPVEINPCWNEGQSSYTFTVTTNATSKIDIKIIGDELIGDNQNYLERIRDILQHSQISMIKKQDMYDAVVNDSLSLHKKIFKIYDESPEQEHIAKAIREQLILTKDEYSD